MDIYRWSTLWCEQGKETLHKLDFPRSSSPSFLSYLKTQNKGNVISDVWSQSARSCRWAFGEIVYRSEHFLHLLLIGHQKSKVWINFAVCVCITGRRQTAPVALPAGTPCRLISFKSNSYNCLLSRCFSDLGTTTAKWKNSRFMKRQPDWKWRWVFAVSICLPTAVDSETERVSYAMVRKMQWASSHFILHYRRNQFAVLGKSLMFAFQS